MPTSPGKIACDFGEDWIENCSHGKIKRHNALDLDFQTKEEAAMKPQRVVAAGNGIVRYASGFGTGWGDAVVLEHDVPGVGPVTTLYGHIDINSPTIKFGAKVNKGDLLGWISARLTRSKPHLHFGVRQSSYNPKDPNPSIAGWLHSCSQPHEGKENRPKFQESWVNPITFINMNRLPDGLYRVSDEAGVFLVKEKVRRVFHTAETFNDWGLKWSDIKVVDPSTVYGGTKYDLPIPHLVKQGKSNTVYWITESFTASSTGKQVARKISTQKIFDGMGFRSSDVKSVSYNPASRFPGGASITEIEPRLVNIDGPFCRFEDDSFKAGWRVRNLSTANLTGLAITTRACQLNSNGSLNGRWIDFPWHGTGGLDKKEPNGWSPAWTVIPNTKMPRGVFMMKVVYSFDGSGKKLQQLAPQAGELRFPDNESRLGAQ